jgi:hypothetical protein
LIFKFLTPKLDLILLIMTKGMNGMKIGLKHILCSAAIMGAVQGADNFQVYRDQHQRNKIVDQLSQRGFKDQKEIDEICKILDEDGTTLEMQEQWLTYFKEQQHKKIVDQLSQRGFKDQKEIDEICRILDEYGTTLQMQDQILKQIEETRETVAQKQPAGQGFNKNNKKPLPTPPQTQKIQEVKQPGKQPSQDSRQQKVSVQDRVKILEKKPSLGQKEPEQKNKVQSQKGQQKGITREEEERLTLQYFQEEGIYTDWQSVIDESSSLSSSLSSEEEERLTLQYFQEEGIYPDSQSVIDESSSLFSSLSSKEEEEKLQKQNQKKILERQGKKINHMRTYRGDNQTKELYNELLDAYDRSNGRLFPGEDLYVVDGVYDKNYDKLVLRRGNSSGKDNNCLLYSIIQDDENLLARVLGGQDYQGKGTYYLMRARAMLAQPESGRDYKPVRAAFFKEIERNLAKKYALVGGGRMTLEDYLTDVVENENAKLQETTSRQRRKVNNLQGVKGLLEYLEKQDGVLDNKFATVFSVLYGKRVIFLTQYPGKDEAFLFSNNLSPKEMLEEFKVSDKEWPLFVYYRSGHYQKLYEVQSRVAA